MPFVLDASIPACWALQDDEDPRADTAFARSRATRLSCQVFGGLRSATTSLFARKHGLSVYDASYLELAVREAIPLAALDAQLIAAARAEGSELI